MNVLHKKNQEKSKRNQGVYRCEIHHNIGQKMKILKELLNDFRMLSDEVKVLQR